MKYSGRVVHDRDVEVSYHQFSSSRPLTVARRVMGGLCWPLVIPLALISRVSDFIFRTVSESLSILPYLPGAIMRQEFYRWSLRSCGRNVAIGFGTVFQHRDIELGDHVMIGMFNTIHFADFGSHVLVGDGCRFLSGSMQHNFDRTDRPMALQGGRLRRIRVDDDSWIGSNAIIMNDLAAGSVVGAGSVVTAAVEAGAIVGGNPAQLLRYRHKDQMRTLA